jgi:hypothetical protein
MPMQTIPSLQHPLRSMWIAVLLAASVTLPALDAAARQQGAARETIPIPRPRPATAPAAVTESKPPSPSACQQRLGPELAVAEPLPAFTGENGCGADDVVRLSAVMTRDKVKVPVTPAATLTCSMAEAVVHWVRDDVAPALAARGPALKGIGNFASYECRGRNRVAGAKLSQHGLANALDVNGFARADGKMLTLTDPIVDRDLRESLRASACARFTTVLGPGSDGYHENHIHIDLIERRNGYRICQWDVRDPTVAAIPIPRERPPDAPPRADRGTDARGPR